MTMAPSRKASSTTTTAYQVECQMTKKGKMFAGSKRRVCWRFGFASRDALEAGESGTACRGEEHEVVMVWSLTSGKQLVLADGHEVHWSKSHKMFGKFECEWNLASGRQLSVTAHASAPLFDKKVEFRQFDLKINGVSFLDLPQMYELGVGAHSNGAPQPLQSPSTPTSTLNVRQVSPLLHEDSMDDQYSVVSDIHDSFYRSQPQLSALDSGLQVPRTISPSPSMPDLSDFSASAPFSLDTVSPMQHPSAPNTPRISQSPSPPSMNVEQSPTSGVTNPFDVYASLSATSNNQRKAFSPLPPQQTHHYAASLYSSVTHSDWAAHQHRQQYFQQQQLQQQPFSPTMPSQQHQHHYIASQPFSVYAG